MFTGGLASAHGNTEESREILSVDFKGSVCHCNSHHAFHIRTSSARSRARIFA
jgi:hypothetical protein